MAHQLKTLTLTAALALAMTAGASLAEVIKSTVTAKNGLSVNVYRDDFADKINYSYVLSEGPAVRYVLDVTKKAGVRQDLTIQAAVRYQGDWRFYKRAVFRGGDVARFVELDRKVGYCPSSRYDRKGCFLTETFAIQISDEELAAHSKDGMIEVQVEGRGGETLKLDAPMTAVEAVKEISNAN